MEKPKAKKSVAKYQQPKSSPASANPMSEMIMDRIDDLGKKILSELAKQQKAAARSRLDLMVVGRTLNLVMLPFRAVGFFVAAAMSPARFAKLLRDWLFIRRSRLLDRDFYLRENPEVAVLAVEPIWHYCSRGWRELRDPSPNFSTNAYLERNRDIKTCGMNPFYHYVRYRKAEPYREGTARPLGAGNAAPILAQRSVAMTLQHVPSPLCDGSLTDDTIGAIREAVREGLYGKD